MVHFTRVLARRGHPPAGLQVLAELEDVPPPRRRSSRVVLSRSPPGVGLRRGENQLSGCQLSCLWGRSPRGFRLQLLFYFHPAAVDAITSRRQALSPSSPSGSSTGVECGSSASTCPAGACLRPRSSSVRAEGRGLQGVWALGGFQLLSIEGASSAPGALSSRQGAPVTSQNHLVLDAL